MKEKKDGISPIEFYPLQFYAKRETEEGGIEHIPVNDPRLAGVHFPSTIENPREMIKRMEAVRWTDRAPIAMPEIKKTAKETEIVRAQKQVKDRPSMSDLANFSILPKIRYIFVNRKGEQNREREKILCEITFDHGQRDSYAILTKDIGNICKKITSYYAIARIDFETKRVEKWIEDEFREAIGKCQIVYCYYEQGWQRINGKWVYVHQNAKCIGNVEYTLTANLPTIKCERKHVGMILLMAFGLYDDAVSMGTMISFSLLGVLYRAFREAGYPPRFLLFLNGKTGSLKTTIAKILFTQLCDDKSRDTPRRIDADTIVSFERALIESGYDTVTLLDDYNPAKSKKKKAEMEDKLEAIVRLVGDSSSKSRSNVNLEDCRGEGVQGIVALTGELRGRGVSSNLRCLYCKMMREKANLENITWFQDNPAAYTTVISEFAAYIGENWTATVQYIKESFSPMRKRIGGTLSEKRLIDAVVILQIVNIMMHNFLREWCGIDQPEKYCNMGNVEQNIIDNALMSQAISCEDSPAIMFVKTVHDLMRINNIVLNTKKVTEYDSTSYDGFEDENYLYFNPELIFKKVRSFCIASNIELSLDMKEIIVALYEEGIIKPAPNGKGKQTYCVRVSVGRNKKQSFLKISKEIFKKVIEDSLDIVW